MNFNRKRIIQIAVILLTIALLASIAYKISIANNVESNATEVIQRDRTNVILTQDTENPDIVHVNLGMADVDSVAAFQIGLDINVDSEVNYKFNWNKKFDNSDVFTDVKYTDESNGPDTDRVNIYYVGTEELNINEVDNIELGTLEFTVPEDIKETSVTITPVNEFSKVSSIGHNATKIDVKLPDDSFGPANIKAESKIEEAIPLKSISLNKTKTTINVGETEKLTVSFDPDNTTDSKDIIWESSNFDYVTVTDDGEIKGIKPTPEGEEITITAMTLGEKVAECKVTVVGKVAKLEGVTLDKHEIELQEGETDKLTATLVPSNAENTEIEFSSSDNSIVTVNDDGEIKAIKEGTATITVTAGEFTDTCTVTVKKASKADTDSSDDEPSYDSDEELSGDNEQQSEEKVNKDDNTENSTSDEDDGEIPKTGDIAVELFVVLMIVSGLGIVFIIISKNKKERVYEKKQ